MEILTYDVFLSLTIGFTLTNRVDPDEMQHYAAFHLGLHCLPKYSFRGLQYTKRLNPKDRFPYDMAHTYACMRLIILGILMTLM